MAGVRSSTKESGVQGRLHIDLSISARQMLEHAMLTALEGDRELRKSGVTEPPLTNWFGLPAQVMPHVVGSLASAPPARM